MAPVFKNIALFSALFAALGSAVPLDLSTRAPTGTGIDVEQKTPTDTVVKPIETLHPVRRDAEPQDIAEDSTAKAHPERSEIAGIQFGCTPQNPCKGQGTFYATGSSPETSACEIPSDGETEPVFALSKDIFTKELCGKSISVSYQGKQVTGKIVDRCAACNGGDLDFSRKAFDQLSAPSTGRIFGLLWHAL